MINDDELRRAISDLAPIDAAGLLGELERDMAAWCEPPIDPFLGVPIIRLARAASRILGEPLEKCRAAANDVYTSTRQKRALELIAWYVGGLAEAEAAEVSADKLARTRRRIA